MLEDCTLLEYPAWHRHARDVQPDAPQRVPRGKVHSLPVYFSLGHVRRRFPGQDCAQVCHGAVQNPDTTGSGAIDIASPIDFHAVGVPWPLAGVELSSCILNQAMSSLEKGGGGGS